jgi:hypothetical protein
MSRTFYVKFKGRGFCCFDVVGKIFLKHLIDAAEASLLDSSDMPQIGFKNAWLEHVIQKWRVAAIVTEYAFFLEDQWVDEQVDFACALIERACEMLSRRQQISAKEFTSWPMLDDERIFARGLASVSTACLIHLGEAVIALRNNTLPEPPAGTWWYYSFEDTPGTMQKKN